jgi:thymidylate synthase
MANQLDKDYQNLLKDILENGVRKGDRTGTGTISIFGRQIRHRMSDGFPILTTKRVHWRSVVTELLWFLEGRTDLKWLLDRGNTIWVGDAYKAYVDSDEVTWPVSRQQFIDKIKTDKQWSERWGDFGPIYGKQWRELERYFGDATPIDQINNLILDLKSNPDSRRLMVTAWNPAELDGMLLPPCHYGFQVYTRLLTEEQRIQHWCQKHQKSMDWGKELDNAKLDQLDAPTRTISLLFNMRSVDVPLGLPFNLASYGLLLEILGKEVNMVPDELIANLGDTHIYTNQVEGIMQQLEREPYPLPQLEINTEFWQTETGECGVGLLNTNLKGFQFDDFILKNYEYHPAISIPLSN